ncbi:MAG: hypothetical protein P4L46_11105 [Fimbriimonas sp.]|nr:hypothetical protein [Fimbriimonas sp.]
MKAVHFGAGNIGRGFLGQLYSESGFRTTFVEAIPSVVDALNSRHSYTIQIAEERPSSVRVESVDAVLASDLDAVASAISTADIVSTAVGVSALPKIADGLALGLAKRFARTERPLDIIVCENLLHAGPYLREQLRTRLAPEWGLALDERIGLVEASIGRMVPIVPAERRAADPLWVAVEAYCELPVDRDAFRGPIPAIRHLKPISPFDAYVERKLYIHNLGHATAAYLGYLSKHEFVWQAMEDSRIADVTRQAMSAAALALSHRHGLSKLDLRDHVTDLLRRFANRALGDQVLRVGADPIRKLGKNDRFVGAIRMCLESGVDPWALAYGAAAALRFDPASDPSAVKLQGWIASDGTEAVVRALAEDDAITSLIMAEAIA